jgi:beta-mannosidase
MLTEALEGALMQNASSRVTVLGRLLLVAFLAFVLPPSRAATQTSSYPKRVSLDGPWGYRPLAHTTLKGDGSIIDASSDLPAPGTMPVPSNWNLQGLLNFNGRVRFERDFDFTESLLSSNRAFLVFHGIDYFADVELNATFVARHEGYFQTFEFDVMPEIKQGYNHLVVTLDAPMEEVGAVWPDHKRLIKGIFSHWDCKPGSVSKEFGQDGTSAGIWNSVQLEVRHVAWLGNV